MRGRRGAALLLGLSLTALLSACGGKGEASQPSPSPEPVVEASPSPEPARELGAYKGLQVPMESAEVTQEEWDLAVRRELEAYAEYEPTDQETVQEGDTVLARVEIWKGGTLLRTLEEQYLTVSAGSGDYRGALAGCPVKSTVLVGVRCGEDYPQASLRGQELEYRVSLEAVVEAVLPQLDEEFVRSHTEYWSVEEYREAVRARLEGQRRERALAAWQRGIRRQVLENSAGWEPDQERVAFYRELARKVDERRAGNGGEEWNAYLERVYQTGSQEEYEALLSEQARQAAVTEGILEQIAGREGITVSERQTEDFRKECLQALEMGSPEELGEIVPEDLAERAALHRAVWNWIYGTCTE